MNPTIRDVARLANTSKSTVSRFLNGEKVKKETEEALKKVIKEINYHRNVNARRLVVNKTQTIGVVVDDITNHFYSPILRGVETIVKEKGYNCVFYSLTTNYTHEISCLNLLYEGQIDGLILLSFQLRNESDLNVISNADYPIVLIGDAGSTPGLASVNIDNYSGIADIVKYLNRIGHQKIAYISGPENLSAARERLQGYYTTMNDLGLDPLVNTSDWSNEGGYLAMNQLLAECDFTAVIASNDEAAIGALRASQDLGYNVPQDFSITGYDDIAISSWVNPSLTTVRQPFEKMGLKAAEYLFNQIENESDSSGRLLLKPKIIIRESSRKTT